MPFVPLIWALSALTAAGGFFARTVDPEPADEPRLFDFQTVAGLIAFAVVMLIVSRLWKSR